MKLTNEIITNDANSVLAGEYVILGVFCFCILVMLVGFIAIMIACKKNKTSFKEERQNIIAIGSFLIVGILTIVFHTQSNIIPLKEDIVAQNWEIKEDMCVNKHAGAVPNLEEYNVYYAKAGEKHVSEARYKKSKVGFKDYIIPLSNGEELVYSSSEYKLIQN